MKRLLLIICSIIINVAVLAQTQAPTPPKYALLEFLKIEPGKNTDYRKDERDVWMPVHRERVKAGAIKSWSQWIVRYPGGVAREYDVVLITTFDKFADLETFSPPGVWEKVHPNTKAADINAQTNAARKLVRTEWLNLGDYVQ